MQVLNNFTFHDEETAVSNGALLENVEGESLTLGVTGTFEGSIAVQGKQDGEWFTLDVINLLTIENASAITAAGSYAVVCPDGFTHIRCAITELTSGSVTVTGRLCKS